MNIVAQEPEVARLPEFSESEAASHVASSRTPSEWAEQSQHSAFGIRDSKDALYAEAIRRTPAQTPADSEPGEALLPAAIHHSESAHSRVGLDAR